MIGKSFGIYSAWVCDTVLVVQQPLYEHSSIATAGKRTREREREGDRRIGRTGPVSKRRIRSCWSPGRDCAAAVIGVLLVYCLT